MHSLSILLLTTLTSLVAAQNPFSFVTLDTVKAGSPFNITWSPSTGTVDTVSLILRQGDAKALNTVATIASHIPNTGSYMWTPSTSLVAGTGYAFEIVDDGNSAINNYSKDFTLDSPNTVSSIMPSTTMSSGSASTSGSASAGKTGSASSGAGAKTTASGSSASAGASGSASSTAASASASGSAPAKNDGGRIGAGLGAMVLGFVAALL